MIDNTTKSFNDLVMGLLRSKGIINDNEASWLAFARMDYGGRIPETMRLMDTHFYEAAKRMDAFSYYQNVQEKHLELLDHLIKSNPIDPFLKELRARAAGMVNGGG